MTFAFAAALLAIQATPPANAAPFTIVFAPTAYARTLPPEGQHVANEVAAVLRANPDATVAIESRGWGGFENYSLRSCHWARIARTELIGRGVAADRIAIRAPNGMAWQRRPSDTDQTDQPQLDFRIVSAATVANTRVMPDSCRLRP